jgi:hypothetical protein
LNLIRVMPAKGQDTMQTSLFLARLIGPTLLIIGISILLNREAFRTMAGEFIASRALIYVAGVLAFMPALALVLAHNIWVADWRVLITLVGWFALLTGGFRLLFPQEVMRLGRRAVANPNTFLIASIVMLILGAILSFYGYVR